ncbi:hypothetical protein AMECASPLE_035609 [Ameca splendens]|uniref:Secreted protein n=1 Tax=Ameca splendens TaxID=208324 RepID=A0ABV0Z692_9TELE
MLGFFYAARIPRLFAFVVISSPSLKAPATFSPGSKSLFCILPKSKFPSFQVIYLDRVLADSTKPASSFNLFTIHIQPPETSPDSAAVSLLSLTPHHSPSSKLIFISIWCLQPRFQFHYSLLKK